MPESSIEKITIIEGPTPIFEFSPETWLPAIGEGATMPQMALCRVRTFNGPALVERCRRAWRQQQPIHLEYRDPDGLTREAQIVAARNLKVDEGDLLILWVRLLIEDLEIEFDFSDDDGFDDDSDDFDDIPDLPF